MPPAPVVIVGGKAKGVSNAYVAAVLGRHAVTVGNRLRKLRREEGILYDVGVIQGIGTGKNGGVVRYFCRACGETYLELRPAADHAFYHVFPDGGGLIVPRRDWLAMHPESPLARSAERTS